MKAALLFTFTGLVLCFWLGLHYLELEPLQIARAVVAANVSAFVGVALVMKLQRNAWVKANLVKGPKTAWITFYSIYFGGLFLIAGDSLLVFKNLAVLFVPLYMTTGPAVLLFGPFQDRIVRALQKKSKAA